MALELCGRCESLGEKLNVNSEVYETEAEARLRLDAVRKVLYPQEQEEARPDVARLCHLRDSMAAAHALGDLTAEHTKLSFAGGALKQLVGAAVGSATHLQGFHNLCNTLYANATLQCLFHSAPFRRDV